MNLAGKLSIIRPSTPDDIPVIRFEFTDSNSRKRFFRVEMTAENFGLAVTGLSEVDVKIELNSLDVLGKFKESEPLSIYIDATTLVENNIRSTDRKALQRFIEELSSEYAKPGWVVNPALTSHNSIEFPLDGNGVILNVKQFRFVGIEV